MNLRLNLIIKKFLPFDIKAGTFTKFNFND
jgi:hypothetical protein